MKRMMLGMMVWMAACGLSLGALVNPSFETASPYVGGDDYTHYTPPGWYCPEGTTLAMGWGVWGTASEGTQCLWAYGDQELAQMDNQTQVHTGDQVSVTWASRGISFDMYLVLVKDPSDYQSNVDNNTYLILEIQTVPSSSDGVTWVDYSTATHTVDATYDGWYPATAIWTTGNDPIIGQWRIVDNVRLKVLAGIQGTVQLLPDYGGDPQDVLVRIELIQNQTVVQTYHKALDANGHFSIDNVAPGTYDIGIKAYAHLRTVLPNVVVTHTLDLGPIPLVCGDCDGDNAITSTDLSIVLANMD